MRSVCQRCGEQVSHLFPALGRRVCFGCLANVMRLSRGYESLQEMAAVDLGDALVELGRQEHRAMDATHCIRCFSPAAAIPGPTGRLCVACWLTLIAG